MGDSTEHKPVGYLKLLSNANYRNLWLGEVVSLFGDWFNLIASAALVSSLTQSGLAVGGLFVVRMLAPFLVSPLAGVAADRYNRKQLLVLSDIARAVVVLGFLVVRDPAMVWLLYVLTAVQLAISGFFFPARNALLPDIVSRRELGAANALSSATWSVMLALGAAAGGVVAGLWGIYPAFVIDSLTFLVSAFFLARIRYTPQGEELLSRTAKAAVRQYLDGLGFLKRHADIFFIALHKGTMSLAVSGTFQVVMVVLAEQVFVIGDGGGTSLGIMYAVTGIGTGLGPILARRFTGDRERPLRSMLFWGYIIAGAGLAISAPLVNFGWVLFGSLFRAVGAGINWVFSTQLLFQLLPDKVRGRVFATEFALVTLANAAGAALIGWMLDHTQLGVSGILWWISGVTLLPGFLWLAWLLVRERRGLEGESRVD
jgi:MFS family permease